MNKNRVSLFAAIVAMVVVLAGGWFLGAQPLLSQAAANAAQKRVIDTANAQKRSELDRLQKAYDDLDTTKAQLAELRASVPESADTADFIRALNTDADETGVSITSIVVGDPEPYAPPGAGAAVASTTTSGTTSAATPSATTTPSPTASAAASPAPGAPLTDPSITSTNFTDIPVTVAVTGDYDKALAFTKAVQSGSRLFLVNGLSATTDDQNGAQAWSLNGYVYVLSGSGTPATAATNG